MNTQSKTHPDRICAICKEYITLDFFTPEWAEIVGEKRDKALCLSCCEIGALVHHNGDCCS